MPAPDSSALPRRTSPAHTDDPAVDEATTLAGLDSRRSISRELNPSAIDDETSTGGRALNRKQHPLFADKVRGLRLRAIRFTASWFSVVMGTGIVATLLFDLPWTSTHPAFRGIAAGFLILGILLFIAFASMTILRYTLYPRIFRVMIQHETHSLFLGCIPMGFITLVSNTASIGHEYGLATLDACLVLWWIALAMSILTSFGVPYVMFTKHNHTAEALTAAWLLPIVPTITVAASATVHCKLLLLENRLDYCLVLFVASYILNGVGLLLASGIMVLYFQRLTLHHLPPREVIVSSFLPVGAVGQGGYALIECGRIAVQLFPKLAQHKPELAGLGLPMLGAGVVSGLMLWGLGIWFAFLAIVSIVTQFTRGSSEMATLAAFNMGWWAFTFPLGSLTLLTFSLAEVFDSMFFKVVSTILTLTVFCLWIVVFIPTAVGFLRGTLFPAPCLQALPKEYVEKVGTSEKGRATKAVVTAEEREREEVAKTAGVA
ncbi:hypothetical protein JCM5296_006077 [Sporobolomyces johnsonii]